MFLIQRVEHLDNFGVNLLVLLLFCIVHLQFHKRLNIIFVHVT
jgi:hypothetical protein